MSDDTKLDQEDSKKPLDDEARESRRKFTKAGLGGGAVLMSLLSRPAMGTGGYHHTGCNASVLASISAGTSLTHDLSSCRFGCDVQFWCEYAPTIAWTKAGASTTTSFNSIFKCTEGGLTKGWGGSSRSPGLLEVLLEDYNESSKWFINKAARESVAAWLNAGILNSGSDSYFEKTQAEIEEGFCSRFDAWKRIGSDTEKWALKNWGKDMAKLNYASCPLSDYDDADNMFYYPKW